MTQLGYAVFFIGHDKEAKDTNGNITNIRPSLSNSTREIIAGMSDIYGYAKQNGTENSVLVLRDKTGFIECGCRFKYVPNVIAMNYDSLTKAIYKAIDDEAQEHNNAYVTDERMAAIETVEYNYEALMAEFQDIIGKIMNTNPHCAPKITTIVERYLGKGKKVSDTNPEQAEFVYLIVQDLKTELA